MEKRYYLSQTDKKLAGVCGGLAEYFDVDPLLVRIVMLFLIFCYGGGLLLYVAMALLAPKGPNTPNQNHFSNNGSNSSTHSRTTGGSWSNTSSNSSSTNQRPNQSADWGGSHYDKG